MNGCSFKLLNFEVLCIWQYVTWKLVLKNRMMPNKIPKYVILILQQDGMWKLETVMTLVMQEQNICENCGLW